MTWTFLKALGYNLFPVPLIFYSSVLACFFFALNKRSAGKCCFFVSFSLLLLFGTPYFPEWALGKLENEHPALNPEGLAAPDYIVVLGGLHNARTDIPMSAQLNPSMLMRLVEGVRLHRIFPEASLVLSGGGTPGRTDAEGMRNMALELGTSAEKIVLETQSQDTHDEAVKLKPLLGNSPFLLVTSAAHMPRSVKLFKKQGLNPIPAPTHYLTGANAENILDFIVPTSKNLMLSTSALYEILGLAKDYVAGRI